MDLLSLKIRKKISLAAVVAAAVLVSGCGNADTAEPEAPPEEPVLPRVIISELMASNKVTLAAPDGKFYDWIELYNAEAESVELGGWTLSDHSSSWTFPELTLGAGEYAALLCDPDAAGALCADFSLSSARDTVTLRDAEHHTVDTVSFDHAEEDISLVRRDDGSLEPCLWPTPGYENSDAGFEAFQSSRETPALSINEVLVFDRTRAEYDGSYPDWVELKNNSAEPIQLSEWYLSDKGSERFQYMLPELLLEPGALYVVQCRSDGPAGFSLSGGRDRLYLTSRDGTLADYVSLHDIPNRGSYGRLPEENGFFYFSSFTKGEENYGGARLISAMPVSAEPDGVFNDVSSVTAELAAAGEIHYTTDGSMPTLESPLYDAPLELSSTCVIRAVSFEPGKLPSSPLELSYIINEGHTIGVASLIIDPEDMNGAYGIYRHPTEDWERPASLSFFDGDSRFSIECGIKTHGATSRVAQSKKSYKINFRNAYGGKLDYDLFENGVTEFSSVLLRAAQESSFSTNMRDIVLQELAQQCCPELSMQDYKFCILYINGEYWGLYSFREAHSPEHFANHNGLDASSVSMWQGKWDNDSDFGRLYNEMLFSSMAKEENYQEVISHVAVEELMAWSIIESWSGNIDINSPNVRFYYSDVDEKLHYALVDLDLGFFAQGLFTQSIVTGYDFSNLILKLCDNREFDDQMAQLLSEYLHGPLSEENVYATIDRIAAEIRPEIERDGARWGYTTKQWERELQNYLYDFAGNYGRGGYGKMFAKSARSILHLSNERWEELFGDL